MSSKKKRTPPESNTGKPGPANPSRSPAEPDDDLFAPDDSTKAEQPDELFALDDLADVLQDDEMFAIDDLEEVGRSEPSGGVKASIPVQNATRSSDAPSGDSFVLDDDLSDAPIGIPIEPPKKLAKPSQAAESDADSAAALSAELDRQANDFVQSFLEEGERLKLSRRSPSSSEADATASSNPFPSWLPGDSVEELSVPDVAEKMDRSAAAAKTEPWSGESESHSEALTEPLESQSDGLPIGSVLDLRENLELDSDRDEARNPSLERDVFSDALVLGSDETRAGRGEEQRAVRSLGPRLVRAPRRKTPWMLAAAALLTAAGGYAAHTQGLIPKGWWTFDKINAQVSTLIASIRGDSASEPRPRPAPLGNPVKHPVAGIPPTQPDGAPDTPVAVAPVDPELVPSDPGASSAAGDSQPQPPDSDPIGISGDPTVDSEASPERSAPVIADADPSASQTENPPSLDPETTEGAATPSDAAIDSTASTLLQGEPILVESGGSGPIVPAPPVAAIASPEQVLSPDAAEPQVQVTESSPAVVKSAGPIQVNLEAIVELANGYQFRGRIRRIRDGQLTLGSGNSEYTFQMKDVRVLSSQEPEFKRLDELPQASLTLLNGQRLRGRLLKETEQFVYLQFEAGHLAVPRADIKLLSFAGRVHF